MPVAVRNRLFSCSFSNSKMQVDVVEQGYHLKKVNSNKLGSTVAKRNEKLVKLLNGVGEMNLGDVKDHSIDAFGDAYEYLMTMYASNAGKSVGEFFTPAEVYYYLQPMPYQYVPE